MKKHFFVSGLILALAVSCVETENQLTPKSLSENPVFISFMNANNDFRSQVSRQAGDSQKERELYVIKLKALVASDTNYHSLLRHLGYEDENAFLQFSRAQLDRIRSLQVLHPELTEQNSSLFRLAVKHYFNNKVLDEGVNFNTNGRVSGGCAGGVGCFRTAVDCNNQAEADFAVASAACLGLGWFPPGWAICQGSALLVESAEKLNCAANLDTCCGL